jgi:hypothetical protein
MSILNEFGQPYKFLDSSARRVNRPRYQSPKPQDFDELVSSMDHATVVGRSRKLFSNSGAIRSAIMQKSMYAIGSAWLPQSLSKAKEWKEQAQEFLAKWYRVADVKGIDFQSVLYLASVAIDRDGDCFVILTETKDKYPAIQLVPSHRVGQRDESPTVAKGPYKGFKITKGIIQNKQGRAIAFRVLGNTEAEDRDISEQDVIQLTDKDYFESVRGIPLFTHAINSFQDMEEATKREMTAMLINSSLAFVESNDFSGVDLDDPNVIIDDVSNRPTFENFEEGTIKYFRAGSNSKIDPITNARPGVEWREFHDRLTRAALQGANWPVNLLDAMQGATGVESRILLKVAERSVSDRQNLLTPFAQRVITYAISKAVKLGLLSPDQDFYKWTFSRPPFLSIDAGRDATAQREAYKLGLVNLTQICESEGRTLEQHLRERLTEEAVSIKLRAEVEQEHGVNIDPRMVRLQGPLALTKDPTE